MKSMYYLFFFSVSCLIPIFSYADGLPANHAFSYFEVGMENISYGETSTVRGYPLNMEAVVSNVVQRSGGYTPIGKDSGFYVQVATTLIPSAAHEQWNIQPFGVIQENERKVNWNELNVKYASLISGTGHQLVAGVEVTTLSFTRFSFNRAADTAAFESATGSTLVTPSGAIVEDSINLTANIGYRYDSTFVTPNETTRFLGGIHVGVPVYYRVENSSLPNTSWIEYFKGYDVSANAGYGIQIFENFMVSTSMELLYKFRPETHGKAVAGGIGRIPEVTIWSARLSAGVTWVY